MQRQRLSINDSLYVIMYGCRIALRTWTYSKNRCFELRSIIQKIWRSSQKAVRDTYFINGVFSLLTVHLRHIDNLRKLSRDKDHSEFTYFHHISVSVSDGLDLDCVAKATFSNYFQLTVPVHCSVVLNSKLF